MTNRSFPQDFLFGCATAAYQIEGGIDNDWSAWAEAGRLKDPKARCGRATDNWNRFAEDFDLLASLGANAYRMSVEWARIEPEPGQFNHQALDHYSSMIDALREHAIEPIVTLLHFTHPRWFHQRCPWHAPGNEGPEHFERFVARVSAKLSDRVRYWSVLNEPMVWLAGAYLGGVIPPGIANLRQTARAFFALVRAHANAYRVLRTDNPEAQIGIATNVLRFAPARSWNPLDRLATSVIASNYNHAFLQALQSGRASLGLCSGLRVSERIAEAASTLDFIGVNYYSRLFVRCQPLSRKHPVDLFYEDRSANGVNDLGWEIYPAGLRDSLLEFSRYNLPLIVTENGIDDRDDTRRTAFLYDHSEAVLQAISQGADVRGYMFWSLLDNFEWLEAFVPRFGLYRVDYASQSRSPTKAVDLYRQIIATRTLPDSRPPEVIKPGQGRTSIGT